MGRTKQLLEQYWYEYAGKIELHWMEQEYFQYTRRPKKYQNYENKLQVKKEDSCTECVQPHTKHGQDPE